MSYDARLVISVADANKNLQSVDKAAASLDATLQALDKTARKGASGINSIADTMTKVVAMERQAAQAAKERATATLAMSKADATAAAAANKLAESQAKVATEASRAAVNEAKAGAVRTKTANDTANAAAKTTAAIKNQDAAQKAALENANKLAGIRQGTAAGVGAAQSASAEAQLAGALSRRAAASAQAEAAQLRLTRAQDGGRSSTLALNDSLSNSRYLLYDVGATYRALSLAMLTIPTASTAVAAAYEKDFAQILRTTTGADQNQVTQLRDDLKELGTEIPVTFSELAKIGSLGAQLGLGVESLASFTDATAKFVATTNVGVDDAALAFGRLKTSFQDQFAQDPEGFFRKIGSSISELGTASNATETEIVAILSQIAPLGNIAGFSAQGVAGLSSALASVRIRPELARGAFQRIISGITDSAEQGSVAMQKYSKYMGITGDEALQLQNTNPQQFFVDFIAGLGGSLEKGVPFTQMLDDIGVKAVRDKQFILALANNHGELTRQMDLTNKSYAEGTYLDESSAPVFETLVAQLQLMINGFKNLADTISGPSLGVLSKLVGMISTVVNGFDALLNAVPGIKAVVGVLMGLSAVVGVMLALKAAQAFVVAGLVGFQQVAGRAGIAGAMTFRGTLTLLIQTMYQLRAATAASSAAQSQQTAAMVAATAATNANTAASTRGAAAHRAQTAALFGVRSAATAAGGALRAMSGMLAGIGATVGITALLFQLQAMAEATAANKEAGKNIAEGLATGVDEGIAAITAKLENTKVNPGSAGLYGVFNWDKKFSEVAESAGISMSSIIKAVQSGESGIAQFDRVLDSVASSKGFKDRDDWINSISGSMNGGTSAAIVQSQVKALIEETINAEKQSKVFADAQGELGVKLDETSGALDEQEGQIDDLVGSIKGAIEAVFGFSDAEGAVQEALQGLGESLAKGGADFSNFSEAGRNNLKALKDVLSSEGANLAGLVDNMMITPQDAAAQYEQYINDVLANVASKGADMSQLAPLAEQAKAAFQANLSTGTQPKILVGADIDATQFNGAIAYLNQILTDFGTLDVTVLAQMQGGEAVVAQVNQMQGIVTAATGEPYTVAVQADTAAANNDIWATGSFAGDIAMAIYTMSIGADTAPASQGLQALAAYAGMVVNGIIDQINNVASIAGNIPGMGWAKNINLGYVGWGAGGAPAPAAAAPAPRAGVSTAPKAAPANTSLGNTGAGGAARDLGALDQGYQNVADSADKAGGAGKKAGKDMADGIGDAAKAVDDYANRLNTGLKAAYDRQYGLQTATDAYYKSLNAIADKRKEDLKSLEDMVTKQKELTNERNKDLVDARKAGIEKNISIKYGETDRAADYANQEQTALDNAAAKQKDIDATRLAYNELKIGMTALTGYSNAAIANREALRGVESQMIAMISAYAASGKSQTEVAAYAATLTSQFQRQTGQLGFNQNAVNNLQGAMGRYVSVVHSVPQTVTTTANANTGAAMGAANGLKNAINSIPSYKSSTVDLRVNSKTVYTDEDYRRVNDQKSRGHQLPFNRGGQVPGFASGGLIGGKAPANPREDNLLASVDGRGLVQVRSQEYIQPQESVDYYGLDFMNAIRTMSLPKFNFGGSPGYGTGGSSSNDSNVVALDASTLAVLKAFMNNDVVLYTNDEIIARSATRGGNVLATKGVHG